MFTGRTDAKTEAPKLWPPDVKNWLIRKYPDAGKDWRQEKKETTEDEMVGWHHWLNGHEFEQTLGDGEGQGRLACCSPWGCKESDMTVQMNNNVLSNVGNKVWKIQSSEDLGFMDEFHTPHQIMRSNQHFQNIQKQQITHYFKKHMSKYISLSNIFLDALLVANFHT